MGRIHVVVAHALNGVIGLNGQMPWHVPADLAHFRRLTWGHPVVMGRRTFESIGRPLPGRTNIVVTRDPGWTSAHVQVAASLRQALDLAARAPGGDHIMVIGGGEVYRQALAFADQVDVSVIQQNPQGDTYFPELDPAMWRRIDESSHDGFVTSTWIRPESVDRPAPFAAMATT